MTGAGAQPASAPAPAAPATSTPLEIVKESIDLEAAPDGRSWELDEVHYRPLTRQGVEALQQFTLSYTQGYQTLKVHAYTLKKDGRRIDIPPGDMLQGHGETSQPGFEDTRTITVIYPNLEIGDQAVMITQTEQSVPWFPDVFAFTQAFQRNLVVRDASLAFTSRGNDAAFHVTADGVEADPPLSAGGKTRHVWHYHNDTAQIPEPDVVADIRTLPHVAITTVPDYADVGRLYAGIFKDHTEVTPEIAKLAAQLTQGERDHRAQARKLYEWVSANIRYVNIVLGAGGFVPHKAADVLKNGYGDCKDHVMLLEALLAAKGIKSSPVLIRAGASTFKLPPAPSPFLFDHLITYIPEFQLFADSTARHAPFGVLPDSDAGKEVVVVATARTAVTPIVSAAGSTITATSTVKVNDDGSADTETRYSSTGAVAVMLRALMAEMQPDQDDNFFRTVLGPGAQGKFQRGQPDVLGESYEFSARYHTVHLANIPGPGALPAALSYKPFSFTMLVGLTLPQSRQADYVCASGTFREDVTATLPASASITTLPPSKSYAVEGTAMDVSYETPSPNIVRERVVLKLDRPSPVCRAADYAKIRPQLSQMVNALASQILYK